MMYSTYQEYLQLPEFRAVCSEVRQRSGGVCEWCGARDATEPHHVAYCMWGTVDISFNLLDVCHQCHCDLHRCSECRQVKLKARHIKAGSQMCDDCMSSRRKESRIGRS